MEMSQKIYNYRLCRGRRIIESAFGTIVKKWAVFKSSLAFKWETIKKIIEYCIYVHNFLITNELNLPLNERRYLDAINEDDEIGDGEKNIQNNHMEAERFRTTLRLYFVSPEGRMRNQELYANRRYR